MSEKVFSEMHVITTKYTPAISNNRSIEISERYFQERCDTFRKEVVNILRDVYKENRGKEDELAAAGIGLLYAQRENELIHDILSYIKKEFSGCKKESEEE